MEKCTFCIQRISEAKSDAVHDNKTFKGSDVKTACQEACSTNAIKFGDINDPESEFHKYRNHELGYYVLEELNVKPNVTYIAKLRNIHSEELS
jgi:molybdopterin-containing oxidoreductase family iron-sulfur binding subunit